MNIRSLIKKFFSFPVVSSVKFPSKKSQPNRYTLNFESTYNEDGLYTNHNCDFMEDNLFKEAYDLGFATGSSKGWHLHWRVYIACWLAERAKEMQGDFVECGTNKGMMARAIIHYTDFVKINKKFYLMDTFKGLVEDYRFEHEKKNTLHDYEECYDDVRRTFSEFDNVILVRGSIPNTLSQVETKKVSFIHIDMNCAKPEIAAGEYFWDKIVPAGTILLDDYAYPGYINQKHAWDAFAKVRDIKVLSIPTGQGLILKP